MPRERYPAPTRLRRSNEEIRHSALSTTFNPTPVLSQDVPSKVKNHGAKVQSRSGPGPTVDEPRRDPRSFTQNLFDTVALRMLEWLPVRYTSDVSSRKAPQSKPRAIVMRAPLTHTTITPKHTGKQSSVPVTLEKMAVPGDFTDDTHAMSLGSTVPSPKTDHKRGSKRIVQDRRHSMHRTPSDADDELANCNAMDGCAVSSKETRNTVLGNHRITTSHSRKPRADSPRPSKPRMYPGASLVLPNTSSTHLGSNAKITQASQTQSQQISSKRIEGGNFAHPSSQHDSCSEPSDELVDSAETLTRFDEPILTALLGIKQDYEHRLRSRTGSNLQNRGTDLSKCATAVQSFIEQSIHYILKEPSRLLASFPSEIKDPRTFQYKDELTKEDPASHSQLWSDLELTLKICQPEHVWDSLWLALEHTFTPPTDLVYPLGHGRKGSRRSKSSAVVQAENSAQSVTWTGTGAYLSDAETARVCSIALTSLAVAALPHSNVENAPLIWNILMFMRNSGFRSLPTEPDADLDWGVDGLDTYLKLMDHFENTSALRLVRRLVVTLSNRVAFSEIAKTRPRRERPKGSARHPGIHRQLWIQIPWSTQTPLQRCGCAAQLVIAWMNTLIANEWDGKAQVRRSSVIGGSLQVLAAMYDMRADLNLLDDEFHLGLLSQLDPMEMPNDWLSFKPDNKMLHLLSFPFLFHPASLLKYFRAINFTVMSKAFENATAKTHMIQQLFREDTVPIYNEKELLLRLRPAIATFFVLTVRRDNVLEDTFNQLWRREKRELLRPIKVCMGMDEGEVGLDHGGVQQEFFRILFAEALNPDFGMFTIDERTRMTWFQPGSKVPLYKFEVLGLLVSLALYNSITLPLTFPLAFYRKLLGLKVKKVEHIEDGWPDLAKGFKDMLNWSDGDVGDIMMRTYEFSYEVYGSRVNVDMEKVGREAPWPTGKRAKGKEKSKSTSFDSSTEIKSAIKKDDSRGPSRHPSATVITPSLTDGESTSSVHPTLSILPLPKPDTPSSTAADAETEPDLDASPSEPATVTNVSRVQFVSDYIFWLTDKSIRPQYDAFARGFFTSLSPHAISIFPPSVLRSVVEGINELDISALQSAAKYEEPYHAEHPTIVEFWDIVKNKWDETRQRQLLEFVTASDRVPVSGAGKVTFFIQRNGEGDERLPTAATCFGKLLLPEYSSQEVLKARMELAMEEGKGFGMA